MTNVEVGVMDVAASNICTHALKIEVRIDEHDVLNILVDDKFAINAMSDRLLLKLGMRFFRHSNIIVDMANKLKVRSLGVVDKVAMSVREVQTL